jgi:hypothetical protein
MRVRQHQSSDASLAAWQRDVRGVLQVEADGRGGLRWTDQIGATIETTWNSARAPASAKTTLASPPLGIVLLDAVTAGSGTHVSGAAVTWRWDAGTLLIDAIGTLSSSTDYTITLGLLR